MLSARAIAAIGLCLFGSACASPPTPTADPCAPTGISTSAWSEVPLRLGGYTLRLPPDFGSSIGLTPDDRSFFPGGHLSSSLSTRPEVAPMLLEPGPQLPWSWKASRKSCSPTDSPVVTRRTYFEKSQVPLMGHRYIASTSIEFADDEWLNLTTVSRTRAGQDTALAIFESLRPAPPATVDLVSCDFDDTVTTAPTHRLEETPATFRATNADYRSEYSTEVWFVGEARFDFIPIGRAPWHVAPDSTEILRCQFESNGGTGIAQVRHTVPGAEDMGLYSASGFIPLRGDSTLLVEASLLDRMTPEAFLEVLRTILSN